MLNDIIIQNPRKSSVLDDLLISIHERNRASRDAHAAMPIVCPHCGGKVTGYMQPALVPSKAPALYVTCLNDACPGASTHTVDSWLDVVMPGHAGVEGAA